ncbi:MAG: putative DNA binding domain-containing protein [Tannerellaceae bacterium]|jgi:predicted HTH transcriptional regulator|nr:putative DNA binding domain-containing protein [Tannerellaceae bacterium]
MENVNYMNKKALLQRLSDIEWDDFEVKKASVELPKNVWETVSAFSNTSGGWLILGVEQEGNRFEVSGVGNPEKMEQDLVTVLRSQNKFNVLINPECRKYEIDGKTVLGFYIPSAERKPVYFNTLQNTFIRKASGDHRATSYDINTLLREQSFGTMSAKAVEGTSVASFSKASYRSFRDYLKRMVPELSYNTLDDDTFNQKLQLVKDGMLTYGGLLFLGDNMEIQDRFPDFRVDYLEIPGLSYADAEPRYTFRIQEQENLWEYYFVLFQRLRIYADNPLHIGNMGIGREDNKQMDALREGLINLLSHADFFSPMKPRIRVFTNRIEFENPGPLPRPVEELMKEDVSVPRNPVLAKLFRTAKLCENAGYGFDKMLAWKKETHREVLFETFTDKTKVTFMLKDGKLALSGGDQEQTENAQKTDRKQPENAQKTARKRTENSQNTMLENNKLDVFNDGREQPENSQKTARKQPENAQKTARKQPENEQKKDVEILILDILKSNPFISRSELSKQIGFLSEGGIRHHLDKMKQNNLIRREGADRGGKWVVLSDSKQELQ